MKYKTGKRIFVRLLIPALLTAVLTGGCRNQQTIEKTAESGQSQESTAQAESAGDSLPEKIAGRNTSISSELVLEETEKLSDAKQFSIDRYSDGYVLLSVSDGSQYLVVPEGKGVPEDLREGVIPLCQPLNQMYLVASGVMDMFVKLDALDTLRFAGLDQDGWCISETREAMERGDILYAGKYSAPDYEMILSEGCSLAIENTMILHAPEVKEQLERLGIPVLVDYSSYEDMPQGRMEWIRFYGVLTGQEELAEEVFENQKSMLLRSGEQTENEGGEKTVAFFYLTASGSVNVRKFTDYLPKMIALAGGRYVCPESDDDSEESASTTMNVQMEAFYAAAKDADYLVYNSSIAGELESLDELLTQNDFLKNFRAVQEGHVYCTSKNLYQASMELGSITEDIRKMLQGDEKLEGYLYPLR